MSSKLGSYWGQIDFQKSNSEGEVGIDSAQLLGNLET